MTLGLSQMPSLRLELRLDCPTCDGDLSKKSDNAAAVALFGYAEDPYVVCPTCYRDVSRDSISTSEAFRRRVRRVYFKNSIVLFQDATGRWLKRSLLDDATHVRP